MWEPVQARERLTYYTSIEKELIVSDELKLCFYNFLRFGDHILCTILKG
jgi:hypothetical protein